MYKIKKSLTRFVETIGFFCVLGVTEESGWSVKAGTEHNGILTMHGTFTFQLRRKNTMQ